VEISCNFYFYFYRCKFFNGSEDHDFKLRLEEYFESVKYVKPKSSRQESSEKYFFATNFKGIEE
jgi:23S rRNA U2552 (ribose-2'-O)-methylase RlmE/FtsJ